MTLHPDRATRASTAAGARVFAVGDIHGQYEQLVRLLDRLPFDPHADTLVFLGDYLNRGPRSREVVEYLIDLARRARTVFLLGNHEQALLEYARDPEPDKLAALRAMGVEATLDSYGRTSPAGIAGLAFLPPEHRIFLSSLLPFYRWGSYVFVHAGVVPGLDMEECPLDRLLNLRPSRLDPEPPPGTTIVFGHTPFETPLVTPGCIGLDTGAVYGRRLTAVELPALRFYHA